MSNYTPKQIAELEAEIRYHLRLYHDLSTPAISDQKYDLLIDKLKEMAPDSPVLNERSQDKYGDEEPHLFPMGSLSKVKTVEEIFARFAGKKVIVSPKIDGASVALRYVGGRLALGLSRGRTETQKGKIITPNVSKIAGVPLALNSDSLPTKCEIRGEAYICKDSFYGIMDQRGYEEMPDGYANPRNLASSSLTCQDPNVVSSHKVRFLACKMVEENQDSVGFVDSQDFAQLSEYGFETPSHAIMVIDNLEKLKEIINEWDSRRAGLPYETDGIVIRLADSKEYNLLGFTGVCPRGAIAYKFEAEKKSSVVLSIERNATRTGRIVPVLNIQPTDICGSVVSRITLNNEQWLRDKDVAVGDTIEFEKANEIIPRLVRVLNRSASRVVSQTPTKCPSCGGAVSEKGKGGDIECLNDECPAKFIKHIRRILEVVEVKGLDEVSLEKMDDAGLLPELWSVFDLTEDALVKVGFGKKESENIVGSLKGISVKATHILACAGVEGWGKRMFTLLKGSPIFTDDKLLAGDFKYEELVGVAGVGPSKAKALSEAFSKDGYGKKFLFELLKRVKPIKEDEAMSKKTGGKLAGKSFLITGTLSQPRKYFEELIVENQGKLASGVSKNLNFLIAGEECGSKLSKAQALEIPVLSEKELLAMIG